jgi:predicted metal-binding membrane protein
VAGVAAARERAQARPVAAAAAVLAAALVAWIVTLDRMGGMDAGPGTDLGDLGWFLGVWATMMAAMMLPATAPVVALFAKTSSAARTVAFVGGYLAVWVAYGLAAYGLYRAVAAVDPAFLAWDEAGRYVAGCAVVAAGLYQLTPLKAVCLEHCRSPMHVLLARWRPGSHGAAATGVEHGAWCAGCCWALMVVLFAVGVMSLFWMAVVAALILGEKALPRGDRLPKALGVGLVALGIWIAAAPGSVPNLTEPAGGHDDAMPSMSM